MEQLSTVANDLGITMALSYDTTISTISHLVSDLKLQKPLLGIVCGSGLSTLVSTLKNVVQIPYSKIEGFADSTGTQWPTLVSFRSVSSFS